VSRKTAAWKLFSTDLAFVDEVKQEALPGASFFHRVRTRRLLRFAIRRRHIRIVTSWTLAKANLRATPFARAALSRLAIKPPGPAALTGLDGEWEQ
jgi:hypothetical protein